MGKDVPGPGSLFRFSVIVGWGRRVVEHLLFFVKFIYLFPRKQVTRHHSLLAWD